MSEIEDKSTRKPANGFIRINICWSAGVLTIDLEGDVSNSFSH